MASFAATHAVSPTHGTDSRGCPAAIGPSDQPLGAGDESRTEDEEPLIEVSRLKPNDGPSPLFEPEGFISDDFEELRRCGHQPAALRRHHGLE